MRHSILFALILVLCGTQFQSGWCAESPGEFESKGAEALKLSQSDPDAIVSAAIFYGKASAAYVRAGDDTKATEMNSYLYWCKKKMTLAQMDAFLKKGDVGEAVASLKALDKVVPASESKAFFDRADAFAKKYPNDFLLVSIRYFEVADRFPESAEGRSAMQLSLAAMQKVVAKAKLSEYKPAATDGKVFIQSEPPGASIIFVQGDDKRETGKKTPGVVQLPLGSQALELELKDYKPGKMTVTIDDRNISKPDLLKLSPITAQVEVDFEANWLVFVDGAETSQKTPCIVDVPIGTHKVSLAKDGFRDISQQITIKNLDRTTLELKAKPETGASALMTALAETKKQEIKELCGKWKLSKDANTWSENLEIKSDGTMVTIYKKEEVHGTWHFEGGLLVMSWKKIWYTHRLRKVDKNHYTDDQHSISR